MDWRDGVLPPAAAMLGTGAEALRQKAEALAAALAPLCPRLYLRRGGEPRGGGGGSMPGRPFRAGRCPGPAEGPEGLGPSCGGGDPRVGRIHRGSCCWTCAPCCRGMRTDCRRRDLEGGRAVILGTAGHVDHGKTALVRPHRGGHRPAGGGEAPGPDHRAGLCPPHPAKWRAAERHRRARPREVHPHHALRLRRAGPGAPRHRRRPGAHAPDPGAPGHPLPAGGAAGVVALTSRPGGAPGVRERWPPWCAAPSWRGRRWPVSAVTGGACRSCGGPGTASRRPAAPRPVRAPRLHVDRVFPVAGSGTVVTGTLTGGPWPGRGPGAVAGGLPVGCGGWSATASRRRSCPPACGRR